MVKLHDQTLRDGHQSLIATRMLTEHMLPIVEKMDQVGFFSMEVWGGATFDVPIRYLNEDPWERLKAIKERVENTPLQMLERAMNIVAYRNFPDDVVREFIYWAKKDGIDYFRIFDALNDTRNLKVPIEAVKENGGHAQGAISYTISPVHTLDFYINLFKELERMGCDSIAIKDMSGILTPKAAEELITGARDAGVKVPIDVHTHCTSGMALMTYMRAIEVGADVVDTCISPFSGGTAQPPTESVVAALRGTEYDTGYDLSLLMEIRKYFLDVWNKYRHLHRIENLMTDPSVTLHQIPGGMLSNLRAQLEQQKAVDKYELLVEEIPRVRAELGYPPLVTPTSQIVGVQALMNVLFGRYKRVPQETKDYVRGMYGRPPGEIKPEIYEAVLGPNWKDQIVDCRPADLLEPQVKKAREELEEMGLLRKPEDVLTYILYPQVGLKFLKGETKPEFTADQLPLPSPYEKPARPEVWKVSSPKPTELAVQVNGKVYSVVVDQSGVVVNGKRYEAVVAPPGKLAPAPSPSVSVAQPAQPSQHSQPAPAASSASGASGGEEIISPMLGVITKVLVKPGQQVNEGDVIAVLEAMKMENDIVTHVSGVVKEVRVSPGDEVDAGVVIAVIG